MLLSKHNTIRLIGYADSTITQESYGFFAQEHAGEIQIVDPEWFVSVDRHELIDYTYGVAFTLDQNLRSQVIEKIDHCNLDCITYIHPTAVCYFDVIDSTAVQSVVGKGSFIGPLSMILLGSTIGSHCIIEAQCLVAHHSVLGNNVQLHPGVIIAGRSQVGNNCIFNLKSAVLPKLQICDNVEVGAISTVTKNIEQSGRWVGTPARRIGDREIFIKGN